MCPTHTDTYNPATLGARKVVLLCSSKPPISLPLHIRLDLPFSLSIEEQTIPLLTLLFAQDLFLLLSELLCALEIGTEGTGTAARSLVTPSFALLGCPAAPGAKVCSGGLLGGLDICLSVGQVGGLWFPCWCVSPLRYRVVENTRD